MKSLLFVLIFIILSGGCENHKEEVNSLYQKGEKFQKEGMYDLAIKEYESLQEKYPKNDLDRQVAQRIEECKKFLRIKGEFERIVRIKEEGRYLEAKNGFLRFIQTYPESTFVSNVKYHLAVCYENIGDFDKAIKIFEEIAEGNQEAKLELLKLKKDEENIQEANAFIKEKKYHQAQMALRRVKKKHLSEAKILIAKIDEILMKRSIPKSKTSQTQVSEAKPSRGGPDDEMAIASMLYSMNSSEVFSAITSPKKPPSTKKGYTALDFIQEMERRGHKIDVPGMKPVPSSVTELETRRPIFKWERINTKSSAIYTLEIDENPSFQKPIIIERLNYPIHQLKKDLKDGIYFWRIKAEGDYIPDDYYSEIASFEIGNNID